MHEVNTETFRHTWAYIHIVIYPRRVHYIHSENLAAIPSFPKLLDSSSFNLCVRSHWRSFKVLGYNCLTTSGLPSSHRTHQGEDRAKNKQQRGCKHRQPNREDSLVSGHSPKLLFRLLISLSGKSHDHGVELEDCMQKESLCSHLLLCDCRYVAGGLSNLKALCDTFPLTATCVVNKEWFAMTFKQIKKTFLQVWKWTGMYDTWGMIVLIISLLVF